MLGSFPPGLIGITLKISVGKLGVEGQLGGHEWDYRRAEDQVLVRKRGHGPSKAMKPPG